MGAALNTGNLGVSALGHSIIAGIVDRISEPDITMFDYGSGIRNEHVTVKGRRVMFTASRCVLSRKLYSVDNLWNIRMSGLLGGLGNPVIEAIRRSRCVLDITGGDSFTDLYGSVRYRSAVLRKKIVLQQKVPLVLMPQTYGPFTSAAARRTVRSIIEQSAMVWTRDAASIDVISDLFHGNPLPDHCRRGVDVAFLLSPKQPSPDSAFLPDDFASDEETHTVGLNISGLLFDSVQRQLRFGLQADYRDICIAIVRWFLRNTDAKILLIPHVTVDAQACRRVFEETSHEANGRTLVIQPGLDQNETKWLIGRMKWFGGARMHSTIAALSSHVPSVVFAYSDKARGVFADCKQEKNVLDLRVLSTQDIVNSVAESWENRCTIKRELAHTIPQIVVRATQQMDEIVQFCVRT